MHKKVIAIDGYASTGKSTLAKQLAKVLGYTYVDSGAIYRAITYSAIHTKNLSNSALIDSLPNIHLEFNYNSSSDEFEIYLNGKNISKEIRTMEVANLVSQVAVIPQVREKVLKIQHEIAKNNNIVMDGRDIGTAVFPNANLKIFIISDPSTRAARRYEELKNKGDSSPFEEVKKNLEYRDKKDSERTLAPLQKPKDAILLDNTKMSIEEQLKWALELISKYNL